MINYVAFPDIEEATSDGLLCAGGDLSLDTLVSAYSQGIFPWFNDDQPILWWSPDPRLILFPDEVKVSRSLRKVIQKNTFEIRCNTAFEQVIEGCALRGAASTAQAVEDTWITDAMHHAYVELHKHNYAHSIEVWQNQELVGGLYGIALGSTFFGESMFSQVSNASKLALVSLCEHLKTKKITLIDCQVASSHLFSMGAKEIARSQFIQHLPPITLTSEGLHTSHLIKKEFAQGIEKSLQKFTK